MNNIIVDIKIQDELRRLFSERGSTNGIKITNLSLGDSDINYDLVDNYKTIKTFPSPFKTYGIRHKLVYEGDVNNVSGNINCNLVKIIKDVDGIVKLQATYNYPPDSTNFITKKTKPGLVNASDFSQLIYSDQENSVSGYVVFLKTIIDNYFDSSNNPLCLKESYSLYINNVLLNFSDTGVLLNSELIPGGWEFIYDIENYSFMLLKPEGYSFSLSGEEATIQIIGEETAIKKQLIFNY